MPKSAPQKRPNVATERWSAIKLVGIDVDGVLTNGGLTFDENGGLTQRFHVRDGYGLVAARHAGLIVAWISGRKSLVAQRRFDELKLHHCLLGCDDKAKALLDLRARHGLEEDQCCFIGDDLPDLPAFTVSGISVAVADADPEVLERADFVTNARGGEGAVREVLEHILRAQGYWGTLIEHLTKPGEAAGPVENFQR